MITLGKIKKEIFQDLFFSIMAKLEMTKNDNQKYDFFCLLITGNLFFAVCCLGPRLADKISCLFFLLLVTLIKIITGHKRMQCSFRRTVKQQRIIRFLR